MPSPGRGDEFTSALPQLVGELGKVMGRTGGELDLGQAPSLVPGFPDRRELASAYFRAAGVDEVPMGFYVALARFRLAIAWQQMYVLWERGALAGAQ